LADALSISDALFGKTRQAVLGLLFGRPDHAFYTREIVHAAQSGASQVQRELDKLTRSGLVTRERRANQVYFQANRDAAVFPELAGLISKTFGVRDIVNDVLEPFESRIEIAFIYGSIAKGAAHATSDVDLLIVGDVLISDLDEQLRRAEGRLGRHISLSLFDREDFARRRAARDHFLRGVLAGPKISLIGEPSSRGPQHARRP